jgi:hypothetical protein
MYACVRECLCACVRACLCLRGAWVRGRVRECVYRSVWTCACGYYWSAPIIVLETQFTFVESGYRSALCMLLFWCEGSWEITSLGRTRLWRLGS